jgi:hypothetical protein
MSNKTLNIASILFIAGFVGFLIFASTRVSLNFDSSYNLLSYQSLFYGKGFYYEFDGKKIPFDPIISTGPELYLPTFLIWKILGKADYAISHYVVITCYLIFFLFLMCFVLKKPGDRVLALLFFLVWFFTNKNIFGIAYNQYIDPLGEVPAAFFIFAGFYFIYINKFFFGFFLLGLALDTKPNVIIAVIPALGLLVFQKFILPEWKRKNYKLLAFICIKLTLMSSLMILPHLIYTKIVPYSVLDRQEWEMFKNANTERSRFVVSRAFGAIKVLYKNPDMNGVRSYLEEINRHLSKSSSFFNNSYISLGIFGVSLALLIVLSRGHFSFYLFICSAIFIFWWFFVTADTWYRYFFIAEFMFILGIIAALPFIIIHHKRSGFILLAALGIIFCARFSLDNMKKSLNGEQRKDLLLMKDRIEKIDEKKIYVYGWLQCPQLMFLSNKRFQDITNKSIKTLGKEGAFFLTSYENTIIDNDMQQLTRNFDLIGAYGYNKLYRIKES